MTKESIAPCTSCCTACIANPNPHKPPAPACPFAWRNLLPVGVIFVNILPNSVADLCSHGHEGDGWHLFAPSAFLEHALRVGDDTLLGGMDYLVQHRFISATYRAVDTTQIGIRVYFIPHDLKHAQGKLRNRKNDVLTTAKKYLKDLALRLTRDKTNWAGLAPFNLVPLIPIEEDDLTLAELYESLASPAPSLDAVKNCDIMERLLDFRDDLEGLGMRSKLYTYQRRSIAMMLQKELDTRDVPDSLFLELISMNGETFYFQPGTFEVLRERPMVASSRGGVLCEELGTGKTVMTLGLILSTLRQLPGPEESIMETRPVVTPLSIRHFPGPPFSAERDRVSSLSSPSKVPSLVELLLHRSRTTPDTRILKPHTPQGMAEYHRRLSLMEVFEGLPLYKVNQSNTPFYMQAREDPTNYLRTDRRRTAPKARIMYLSAATLVVVPANLLSQWDREIQKHCEYPLRVLLLRTGTALPDVHALANDYDIILTTYNRFTAEDTQKGISKLHTSKLCSCPEHQDYRIPNCKCKPFKGVSPFLRIRWKRLVIDEGHVSASLNSVFVPFTKLLSVERRWIVTGTPTTNLLGLGLGRKGEELGPVENDRDENEDVEMEGQDSSQQVEDSFEDFEMGEPTPASSESTGNSPTPGLTPFSSSVSASSSASSLNSIASIESQSLQLTSTSASRPCRHNLKRIWTIYDRQDLTKLGKMITHFIAVPRFAGDPKVVSTHIIGPLLDPSGPRPGAISVLRQVMEAIMIRHRIEDVERDVVLPPIKHESVMLDLDPYAIKSYNAHQAALAINAVDSERKDQDYMFHPKNAENLQHTVKIMSQIMFWSVDHDLYNADQLRRNADLHINTALERKATQDDIQLLHDAFRHIRSAAEDNNWRRTQAHEDVPYRVYDMHHGAYDNWTRIPREEHEGHDLILPGHQQDATAPKKPTYTGLMHPDRLLRLRDLIISHPLASIESIIKEGVDVAEHDRIHRQQYEEQERRKQRKNKGAASSRSQMPTTDTMEAEPNSEATSTIRKRVRNHRPAMHVHDELYDNAKTASAAKKAHAPETMKEVQKVLDESLRRIQAEEAGYLDVEGGVKGNEKAGYQHPDLSRPRSIGTVSKMVAKSPLASTRVGSSASSKLNYIINDVLQYSSTEKLLIFSESGLSLAHVAEALDLIQVKYLRFTTLHNKPQFREQLVLTFETSETFRVFLMELRHGARGLNLISASRVIFCEPVWQADIESQAIKRAHRIGQTKPIVVKTLAIRGTAEEAMVTRRNALKDQVDKLPKLIEEAGMRHFIANPKFIEDVPTLLTPVDVTLFQLPDSDMTNVAGASNTIDISSNSLPGAGSPPILRVTLNLPKHASVQAENSNPEGRINEKIGQSVELQVSEPSDSPSKAKKRRVVRFEDD